mmetsp:Transcript_18256/g.21037  ORF Transcript_18256/g.21037 Transcript_18256/m.21037 type:complete len:252 (+) Transcript_18256:49-804(+)
MNINHEVSSTEKNMSSSCREEDAEIRYLEWDLNEKRNRCFHLRQDELNDICVLRATLRVAHAYLEKEEYEKSLSNYESIVCAKFDVPDEIRARAYHGKGLVHMRRNDDHPARESFQNSINYSSKSNKIGNYAIDTAECLFYLGVIFRKSRAAADIDMSMCLFLEALHIRRSILGCDNVLIAEVLKMIGNIHIERNEQIEAYEVFSELRRIEAACLQKKYKASSGGGIMCVPKRGIIGSDCCNDWEFAASAA